MAINYANLEAIKYPPELLPSAEYCSPGVGTTAEIMNLTRLPANLLVRLKDVGAQRSNDAELRLKVDSETFNVPAAAIPNLTEPTQYDLLASKSARLQVHGIAGLTNYKVWHSLLCWKATIADKLALGIPLTAKEKEINEKLGISKTTERGTLPIKFPRIDLYEHYPIYRETRTIRETVPVAGLTLETFRPRKIGDQFVALEKVSCETPAPAPEGVTFNIWRDDDGSAASPLISLNTWSMGGLDCDIPMWIPALREINMRIECTVQQDDYRCRWTFGVYRLTNILRVRWGITAPEERPELWEKVVGGIV